MNDTHSLQWFPWQPHRVFALTGKGLFVLEPGKKLR